jgi:WD40 repeat protein
VYHATFSPDGVHAASVDATGVLKLWEMRTATCLATTVVGTAGSPANRCAFDPTGAVIAVGSEDSVIRLFSSADPEAGPLCEMAAHTDAVQGVAFNRATGALVSGSADGTVRTWVFDA